MKILKDTKTKEEKMSKKFAEYIWLDGSVPTQQLRSKTRVVEVNGEPQYQFFQSGALMGLQRTRQLVIILIVF